MCKFTYEKLLLTIQEYFISSNNIFKSGDIFRAFIIYPCACANSARENGDTGSVIIGSFYKLPVRMRQIRVK